MSMPKDGNHNPIPVLGLKDSGAHSVGSTAVSARNSTAFDSEVISIYATSDVYIKLGSSDVEATTSDHFFPAGVYYDIALGESQVGETKHTHIAVLRVSADGTLYISEKE